MACLITSDSMRAEYYGEFLDIGGERIGRFRPVDFKSYWNVPDSGRPIGFYMGDGLKIVTDNVPTKIRIKNRPKQFRCLWLCRSLWIVCEEFRQALERLEPRIHQFFPVDVIDPKSGEVLTRTFIINVCNRLDAVDQARSSLRWINKPDGSPFCCKATDHNLENVTLQAEVIEGRHLWFDKWFTSGGEATNPFCSEELRKEVENLDLKGMKFTALNVF